MYIHEDIWKYVILDYLMPSVSQVRENKKKVNEYISNHIFMPYNCWLWIQSDKIIPLRRKIVVMEKLGDIGFW